MTKNSHNNTNENHKFYPTASEELTRRIYSIILYFLVPLVFIVLKIRSIRRLSEYGERISERFGFITKPSKTGGYLVHCVSVGEVVAASAVIKALMEKEPNTAITVTTTTPTGSARVKSIFGDTVHHFYLPYDLNWAMKNLLNKVKPKAVLITEVELWPNFIHHCWKRNIPAIVINARMTERSAKKYQQFPRLFTPMLKKLAHVCAQGERDYQNYLGLGVSKAHLTLTNNIKFDQVNIATTTHNSLLGLNRVNRPIFVAGSTHDPEEDIVISAAKQGIEIDSSLLVIMVPRHPERFDKVENILINSGLSFCKSSQVDQVDSDVQVVLVDQMGKLNDAYSIATIAFVGGSIADKGGHNALEPAAHGLPIMMGPNTYNNPEICNLLLQSEALHIVNGVADMVTNLRCWLQKPELAMKVGEKGQATLKANVGALDKTLSIIHSLH